MKRHTLADQVVIAQGQDHRFCERARRHTSVSCRRVHTSSVDTPAPVPISVCIGVFAPATLHVSFADAKTSCKNPRSLLLSTREGANPPDEGQNCVAILHGPCFAISADWPVYLDWVGARRIEDGTKADNEDTGAAIELQMSKATAESKESHACGDVMIQDTHVILL